MNPDIQDTRKEAVALQPVVVPRRHTYILLDGRVDLDGWWKWSLKRDDGRIVKATKSRVRQLRRKGQMVERHNDRLQ